MNKQPDYKFAAEAFDLTARQLEVVTLVMAGTLDKHIADKLNVSVSGVRKRLEGVFRKTGTSSRWSLFLKIQAMRTTGSPDTVSYAPLAENQTSSKL